MLEIRKISKVYLTNGLKSKALDKISVNFRESEFASILGPSGSGKTTFLNIIGGLDDYTSGDLIINEISTKRFKDSDWDSYRNHRIGFVFQSYNLISHQSVLRNVSLALTLSGISKREANRRAKKALEEVGLKEHINKRPNQLSGGQMQRVAIARALVNDPDILLADEPTGALDSETSVQIMEILKKVSKDKLVIMVTHNPELASEYSTRIINLKDGKITSDSNPYDGKLNTKDSLEKKNKKSKKTKMSLLTSFGLSFNNLMTKKTRTLLVSIAGSIGIIGIALILALSNGFQRYVDTVEEDTLTSYPLMLMQETTDITSVLLSAAMDKSESTGENTVKENQLITDMLSNLSVNDLESFKKHLDENEEKIKNDVSKISYNYSVDPLIYSENEDGKLLKLNPSNLFTSIAGGSSSLLQSYSTYTSIYAQLPTTDENDLNENYKLLAGRYPQNYDEIIINLKDPNVISELLVYSLGFRDINDLRTMITKIMAGEMVEKTSEPLTLTYDELMNKELKLLEPSDLYRYNSEYNIYEDMSENQDYMQNLFDNALTLKIVGIMTPNDDSDLMSTQISGIYYTKDLISHIIDYSGDKEIVKKQQKYPEIDVFSGKRFDEENDSLGLDFRDFVSIDKEKLQDTFGIDVDENEIQSKIATYISEIGSNITTDITPGKKAFEGTLNDLIDDFGKNLPDTFYQKDIDSLVENYMKTYYPSQKIKELTTEYVIPETVFKEVYSGILKTYLNAYLMAFAGTNSMNPEFVMAHPELFKDQKNLGAMKDENIYSALKSTILENTEMQGAIEKMGASMVEAKMKKIVLSEVGELASYLTNSFASSFNVDPDAISSAFELSVTEEEITRIVTAMLSKNEATATSNLITLGYQDIEKPTSIYIYFSTFEGKENFLKFIEDYNNSVDKEKEIKYSDTTGILMSSVKTIVDAVTYVLIGFVSISLVVSSIMIGVITYISVYERTKEIGILRAVGASKHNISSIFNAETFIIGLLSGLIAMGISYLIIPLINAVIYHFTEIAALSAYLSFENAIILVVLSIILTLIGGFIPAKSASKKDPVEALRTE